MDYSVDGAAVDVERRRVGMCSEIAAVIVPRRVQRAAKDNDAGTDALSFERAGNGLGVSAADPCVFQDQRSLDVTDLVHWDSPVVRVETAAIVAVSADLPDVFRDNAGNLGTETCEEMLLDRMLTAAFPAGAGDVRQNVGHAALRQQAGGVRVEREKQQSD